MKFLVLSLIIFVMPNVGNAERKHRNRRIIIGRITVQPVPPVQIECTAKGNSLSRSDESPKPAEARFTFTLTRNARDERVLKNIDGNVTTDPADRDVSCIGNFKISSLAEDPNYKPRKYLGYAPFKMNATDTEGSTEDSMWGEFLLQRNQTGDSFNAKYIFKAGDHMGGTLHLTCKKK